MVIPTDCSWIWRKILELRPLALQFLTYKVGNGNTFSLRFDPWWRSTCIVHNEADLAIRQSGISSSAKVSTIIVEGVWRLPQISVRSNHLSTTLTHWLSSFDFSELNTSSNDCILWNDHKIGKIKAWHTWDAIRLASFGMNVNTSCLLCAGGLEEVDHLFLTCPFSSYILQGLCRRVHTSIRGNSWLNLLDHWGSIIHPGHHTIVLLVGQVFAYHIWRERNSRMHNKRAFGPSKIVTAICVDVRARICKSRWLDKF
ncbi:uncharacterized protein LOC141719720 [Apium graveolens]|uniref:uncharacterized protein LOC141719720 n=1 Tax=Apium graveolens TaxID=4045 RepID=UPI003D79DDD2